MKYPLPCGSADKESACNAGDLGLIPGLGRSPGGGYGNSLQYSWIEESGRLQSMGLQRVGHDQAAQYSTARVFRGLLWKGRYDYIGVGNAGSSMNCYCGTSQSL